MKWWWYEGIGWGKEIIKTEELNGTYVKVDFGRVQLKFKISPTTHHGLHTIHTINEMKAVMRLISSPPKSQLTPEQKIDRMNESVVGYTVGIIQGDNIVEIERFCKLLKLLEEH